MKVCPKCGLKHNDDVLICDCGYELSSVLPEEKKLKISDKTRVHNSLGTLNWLKIVGWCWFGLFLIVAILSYIAGTDLSESRLLIHFPYHTWKIAKAIWWLLLSLMGLLVAMLAIIADRIE